MFIVMLKIYVTLKGHTLCQQLNYKKMFYLSSPDIQQASGSTIQQCQQAAAPVDQPSTPQQNIFVQPAGPAPTGIQVQPGGPTVLQSQPIGTNVIAPPVHQSQ